MIAVTDHRFTARNFRLDIERVPGNRGLSYFVAGAGEDDPLRLLVARGMDHTGFSPEALIAIALDAYRFQRTWFEACSEACPETEQASRHLALAITHLEDALLRARAAAEASGTTVGPMDFVDRTSLTGP